MGKSETTPSPGAMRADRTGVVLYRPMRHPGQWLMSLHDLDNPEQGTAYGDILDGHIPQNCAQAVCVGTVSDLIDRADKAEQGAANAETGAAALAEALRCIDRGLTNGQKERGETFQSIARAALARWERGE